MVMKLNPPKKITFYVALVLALFGLISKLFISALDPFAFWIVLVAFVLLALGNFVEGL
jgi:hypothetical protein